MAQSKIIAIGSRKRTPHLEAGQEQPGTDIPKLECICAGGSLLGRTRRAGAMLTDATTLLSVYLSAGLWLRRTLPATAACSGQRFEYLSARERAHSDQRLRRVFCCTILTMPSIEVKEMGGREQEVQIDSDKGTAAPVRALSRSLQGRHMQMIAIGMVT